MHLIVLSYVLLAICLTALVILIRIYKSRKNNDKPIIPQHKRLFRTPTWRFQKFHPNSCPHYNGIYREVDLKIMDKSIKKTIFVCADCVSAIELSELRQRDKFKK
jgi:hypothetical protein